MEHVREETDVTLLTQGEVHARSAFDVKPAVPPGEAFDHQLEPGDRAAGEVSHRWPHVLPDGETLLFSVWTGPGADEQRIVRQSLVAGAERSVLLAGANAPWSMRVIATVIASTSVVPNREAVV